MSRRRVRRWLRGTIRIALGFVLVALLAVGLLQTAPGKGMLARWINRQQTAVQVGTIGGFLPGRIEVDRIEMRDASGAWMALHGVHARVSLRDLLRRSVVVERLSVSNAVLQRWPQGKISATPRPAPQLPTLPFTIDVRDLAVDRIALPADLVGEAVALRLSGSGNLTAARTAVLRCSLERIGGPGLRIEAKAAAEGEPLHFTYGLTLDEARGGRLWSRLLTPDAGPLRASFAGGGSVTNLLGNLELGAAGVGDLRADARFDFGETTRMDVLASVRNGSVRNVPVEIPQLHVVLTGPFTAPRGTLEGTAWLGGIAVTGSTAVAFADGSLAVTDACIYAEGVTVEGHGTVRSGPRRGRVGIRLRSEDVSALAGRFGVAVTGRLDATASVETDEADMRLDLALRAADLSAGGFEFASLETRLAGTPSAFTVAATGRCDRISLAFDVGAELVRTNGAFTGTLGRMGLTYRDRFLASQGPVTFGWTGVTNLFLGPFALRSGQTLLSGRLSRDGDSIRGALDVTNASLADLALAGITGWAGRVAGAVRVSGDVSQPEVTGQLGLVGIAWAVPASRGLEPADGVVEWTLREGRLEATARASGVAGVAEVAARGEASLGVAWSLQPWRFAIAPDGARVTARAEADMEPLVRLLVTNAGLHTGGRLAIDLSATGDLRRPTMTVTGTLSRLLVAYGPHEARADAPIVFRWDGARRLALDPFTLRSADAMLSGRGSIDGDRVAATLRVTNVPLAYLDFAGATGLEGRVSGGLDVSGAMSNPSAGGSVSVTGGSLPVIRRLELLPIDTHLEWELSNGLARAAYRAEGLPGVHVEGEAGVRVVCSLHPWQVGIVRGETSRLHIRGSADVGSLWDRLLTNAGMHADGRLTVDLVASGDLLQPAVSGDVKLVDGLFENPATGTLLRDIRIVLAGDRSALRVVEAKAHDVSGGSLDITGAVGLDSASGYPLAFTGFLSRAEFLSTRQLSAAVDGTLTLTGPLRAPQLIGQLLPRDLNIRLLRGKPRGVEVPVVEVNHPSGVSSESARESATWLGTHLGLDLSVEMPERFIVGGRGLSTEWRGQIAVKGVPSSPVLKGRLSLARGTVTFLGRRFDLLDGTLAWIDRGPAAMVVDITAEARAAEVRALLNVTGPLRDPRLSLTSDPPLPQDEILARILFGRGTDTITPFQAVVLANGIRELRGAGNGFSFLERGREWLHVDSIGVTQAETEDEGTVTGVTVGKYVNDRIYVQGEKGIAGAADTITIDLELTPSLSLQTERSARISDGIRLNWRRDY